MATRKRSYRWEFTDRRPWRVDEYHDTTQNPQVRKCHTPFGTVLLLAVTSPTAIPGVKRPGTFYEFQRHAWVYTGWIHERHNRGVLEPSKDTATHVIAHLRATYPRLERMR
jgi:hypothetical protein